MELNGDACACFRAFGLVDACHILAAVDDGITTFEDRARICGVEGSVRADKTFAPTGNRWRFAC